MTKMIASKAFTYATRRLLPGQDFETKNARDARLLAAVKKATPAAAAGAKVPPPPAQLAKRIAAAVAAEPVEDPRKAEIRALREELHGLTGKNVFSGWDADTLKAKIAAARG